MHYGMRRQIVCFLAAITSLATKAAAESLKSEQTPLASLTPLRLDQVKVDGEFGRRIGQIIENDLLTVTSNTGRLAALMLSNVCIVPYGRGEPFDEELLRGDDTWLLLPDAKSSVPRGRPQRLVLLDATFRQARRMYREISGLRLLPQCALNSPEQCRAGTSDIGPGRRLIDHRSYSHSARTIRKSNSGRTADGCVRGIRAPGRHFAWSTAPSRLEGGTPLVADPTAGDCSVISPV